MISDIKPTLVAVNIPISVVAGAVGVAKRRREFLWSGCGVAVLVAGCVTAETDDTAGTDEETNASDGQTANSTAGNDAESDSTNGTDDSGGAGDPGASSHDDDTASRTALSNVIARVADAADPEAVADEHDIEYRDGTVRVFVQLDPTGNRPDEHISEVTTELDGAVIAWVHVSALAALGDDENVRSVRPVPTAEPHG